MCCDSLRLNQVLLNLLSNAIKFTPEEGSIEMALYEESSPKGEDYIRLRLLVRDTGIGMSAEFKEKVFESFTREDRTRVQRTEFSVVLDMEKAEVQEEDMILPDWNMLVVDDDRQLCESTVQSLTSIGVKAEWALDGETAIGMVSRRRCHSGIGAGGCCSPHHCHDGGCFFRRYPGVPYAWHERPCGKAHRYQRGVAPVGAVFYKIITNE